MKRLLIVFFIITSLSIQTSYALEALPQSFTSHVNSKFLSNPSVILVDQANMEIVYQNSENRPRTPASVLKIFSTAAIALTLDSKTTFQTSLYKTDKKGVFVLWGDYDPWITSSVRYRDANNRAYMPRLIKAAFASNKKLKKITLIYKGVGGSDIYQAKKALKRRASVAYKPISKGVEVESLITEKIATIESPPLEKMIRFALLYSDNVLSQKLAMLAARKSGFPLTKEGLNQTIKSKVSELGVDTTGMRFIDGSGLSNRNKVSASTVSQLLLKVKIDPRLKPIYDHLPISGESGTLASRFIETAPQAIGLVRAKTGSIKGTVSLAGFVTSGEKEYVFVVLADGVGRTRSLQDAARRAIDRMLGTITKPPVIGITPPTPESTPFTTAQ
jgi:D-alanyl-D-alanine carboxypeptidase/D-alanyl-D-alanine-endopeptidase (penicillin-binding protein 4)